MAALRKAAAYSKKKARAFTRNSKTRSKAYIKVIPPDKVVKYSMGNQKNYSLGKHKFAIKLLAQEKIQIRDNAVESCRMILNKLLEKEIPGQFYFRIKIYPHHILRENRTAAGAGADRLSSGMKHSFGIIIGRAAMVKPGQEIFVVSCEDERTAQITKRIMVTAKAKVPCKTKVFFEKLS